MNNASTLARFCWSFDRPHDAKLRNAQWEKLFNPHNQGQNNNIILKYKIRDIQPKTWLKVCKYFFHVNV